VDPGGDGGDGLSATGLSCGSCGAQSSPTARFCSDCGARLTQTTRSAEYKQVTVLFADVVHSMDIAAAVGAERLREIMAELADRCAVVVQRYGGTVDKFTGDGIMALFGAPIALEDHAIRACLAALGVQEEAKRLAVDVQDRDGVELQLRIGLNSGQVIAGEIGSGPFGYTAIGEQVGMAQRMESVTAPGGVMLSECTARLVDGLAALGERELVQIKGADEPVAARRLLHIGEQHHAVGRAESNLVGRQWEMAAAEGLLQRAVDGHGAVVAESNERTTDPESLVSTFADAEKLAREGGCHRTATFPSAVRVSIVSLLVNDVRHIACHLRDKPLRPSASTKSPHISWGTTMCEHDDPHWEQIERCDALSAAPVRRRAERCCIAPSFPAVPFGHGIERSDTRTCLTRTRRLAVCHCRRATP
jgi:class 3 adenylate cyclase